MERRAIRIVVLIVTALVVLFTVLNSELVSDWCFPADSDDQLLGTE
jgi:hypothetical protein